MSRNSTSVINLSYNDLFCESKFNLNYAFAGDESAIYNLKSIVDFLFALSITFRGFASAGF